MPRSKMKKLITTINDIVRRSTVLKNKFTNASTAQVEFACIFCQKEEEYKQFTNSIETFGEIVERTQSGFTYLLDKPIVTIAGPLRLVKIRKPDALRLERGDADFNTDLILTMKTLRKCMKEIRSLNYSNEKSLKCYDYLIQSMT